MPVQVVRTRYMFDRRTEMGASRAPQVVLGTFGRLKLEVLGIVRIITESLNLLYLQGKVPVGLRAGDGNRTRVLSLGS